MKKINVKKIFKFLPLVLAAFLLADAFLPPLFYHPKENLTPLPAHFQKGVYHFHSSFSDGTGDIDEITKAAASLDLDFAILTDHGRPNIPCVNAAGYYHDVLLIGASEFSLNCGHMAAMGFTIPGYIFPSEPQEAINDVIANNGICFVSHPYDRTAWTDWDITNFTGIEIMSAASCAGKLSIPGFIKILLQYRVDEKYALLNTLFYPEQNIQKWDELNGLPGAQYYGIYALDAHAKLALTKKIKFHFPPYRAMFNLLTVYIKNEPTPPSLSGNTASGSPGKDAVGHTASILSALRQGRFFNVIEAIAPANGFDVVFEPTAGSSEKIEMGQSTEANSGMFRVTCPFAFETGLVLKKDGKTYKRMERVPGNTANHTGINGDTIEIPVSEAGVYYLEIYVMDSPFDELPWIVTNPFFIGSSSNPVHTEAIEQKERQCRPAKLLAAQADFFIIEKNSQSEAHITYRDSDDHELITCLDFLLEKENGSEDFWVCLAHRANRANRESMDWTGYDGLVFDARLARLAGAKSGGKATPRLRFWAEIRTTIAEGQEQVKETWYRHSFLAGENWQRIVIPFEKFYTYHGKKKKPELSQIQSLFFSINNAAAYRGTSGSLELKNTGLY